MREDDAAGLVPPGTRAEVLEWIKGAEGLTIDGYAQAARMLGAVDVPREAAGVSCPAKVVVGEKDERTPPETNAKKHRRRAAERDAAHDSELRTPAAPRVSGDLQRRGARDGEGGQRAGLRRVMRRG